MASRDSVNRPKEIHLYIQDMTADERAIVKAGCLINFNRNKKK